MVRVRYSFGSRHTGRLENIRRQKEKFPEIARKVVEISDIVLEVLDARFAGKMRNYELEKLVQSKGKKLIYVLNKSDLLDGGGGVFRFKPRVFVSTKTRDGIKKLREKIIVEAKKLRDEKRKRVHVGVIGYPNAGKSSLINLLARRASARASKQAGFTKGIQKIRFAEKLLLLDTPGVIPVPKYSSSKLSKKSEDVILGARSAANLKEPEAVFDKLFLSYAEKLKSYYGIEAENSEEFLELLCMKKSFLKKGGKPNTARAAHLVLSDFQDGRIRSG